MFAIVVAFVLYSLIIVGVGVLASRRGGDGATSEDYFLGGRTLGPWIAALSAGASGSSAWVTMGLVGLAFSGGVSAYWLIPGVLVGVAFNWLVLARPMRARAEALGAVTLPDLLALHFAERRPVLRLISVAVILSAMFLYVAAQMAAAGKALDLTFGLDYRVGVGVGAVIVLAYTVVGGFRATCWTDALQAVMMLAALLGMPIVLLVSGVAPRSPLATLEAADPKLVEIVPAAGGPLAVLGFLIGAKALGVNLGYPGQPHVLVRLMALRDRRVVLPGAVVGIAWTTLIYLGAITTGVLVRAAAETGAEWAPAVFADDGDELALIVAAMNTLPGVIAAFVLAAVLAAMASTADSQLIVAASAVASDGFDRVVRRPGGRPAGPWLNRIVVLILGLGAALLVIDQDVKVYTYVLTYGWAILGASFGPQIALMLLWRRSTYAGCIAGMLTGFMTAVGWKLLQDAGAVPAGVYNLTVAFPAAAVVNVGVCLLTRPPREPPGALHRRAEPDS